MALKKYTQTAKLYNYIAYIIQKAFLYSIYCIYNLQCVSALHNYIIQINYNLLHL